MKTILPMLLSGILALSLTTTSCKRDDGPACDISESTNKDSTSIVGTWELRSTHGFLGNQLYADCNGNRLVFNADGTYRQYTSWTLTRQGIYQVFPDSFLLVHRGIQNRIVYDNNTSATRQFVINRGTSMELGLDANDGGGSTYVRRNSAQ